MPKSKADLAFTMHMLSWLAVDGTAAIVEFPGVLYRGGAEQKTRKYMIDNIYVDAVIQSPPDLGEMIHGRFVHRRTVSVSFMYSQAMASMSVSTARSEMRDLLEAVARGEEVTLTRHGAAVAVVVRPDLLRVRRASPAFAGAAEIAELLATARSRPLPESTGLSVDRADELVAEVRAARSGR